MKRDSLINIPRSMPVRALVYSLLLLLPGGAWAQASAASKEQLPADVWQVPTSRNTMPHFEQVDGRKVLYVDGAPFTALAVEIPWWHLIFGRYKETQGAYDYLYAAAQTMGLNTLKVPVKWSMIEPEKGRFDFSYVDHAKAMAEKHHLKLVLNWFGHYASGDGTIYGNLTGDLYAPMYIVQDEKTYPRAVDADGVSHHNAMSYDYEPVIEHEIAAFTAFMKHIKSVDSQAHTIIMIQVENEIAVFGADRRNQKLWRDHSAASNKRFAESGIKNELKYSAWDLSHNWIRRITDAGARDYALPFFHNFVGGKLAESIVGGSPGEDVETYLKECPNISFVGVNSYLCAEWLPDNSCNRPASGTLEELRAPLIAYKISRNIPAVTETNSGKTPLTARFAYVAVGEFGAPIFAPWALTDSYPEDYEPYVLADGTLANGAPTLRDAYTSLTQVLPQISYFAGTNSLKVFMSPLPGQRFSETADVNGFSVNVRGGHDGQAIVIHKTAHEFLLLGYRASVTFNDPSFAWPQTRSVKVESGHWTAGGWVKSGEPTYGVNESGKSLDVELVTPQAVRVSW
jgi:hypothetical protein